MKNHTSADYAAAFRVSAMAPHHLRMLQAHYHAPHRTLTATQLSRIMGYPVYKAANLHYGKLARIIGQRLGSRPLPEVILAVLVTFDKPSHEWLWIMRPPVARALEQLGWVGDKNPLIPEEIDPTEAFYEGDTRKITVNAYESSGPARAACVLHYGCHCVACGVTLAERYGDAAQGLIHVHHVSPRSKNRGRHRVDPIRDLRPVCPDCHAVIHSRTPPFSIKAVAAMVEAHRKK